MDFSTFLSSVNVEVGVALVSGLLTLIGSLVSKKYLEDRPKIDAFYVHSGAVTVPATAGVPSGFGDNKVDIPAHTVHMHAMVVRNSGQKSGTNVRLGHNFLPPYAIHPPLAHRRENHELIIPTLAPGEQITVTYVYWPPLIYPNVNSYKKCDEQLIDNKLYEPSPVASRSVKLVAMALIFLGASTVVYWLLRLLIRLLLA